jgi:hypothetical protein
MNKLTDHALASPRRAYETDICARLKEADVIPFREVSIGDWRPAVAECHQNVDRWVRSNPQSVAAVRGWVTCYAIGELGHKLAAHTIVKDVDGTLFDITPLADERARGGMRFVAHLGDDLSFFAMEASGNSFTCPPDLLRDLAQQGWSPVESGDTE